MKRFFLLLLSASLCMGMASCDKDDDDDDKEVIEPEQTTEPLIKYGNQVGTVEDATGKLFYDSNVKSWFIILDQAKEGNIDSSVYYYPIALSDDYKKAELRVQFSGTVYQPEFTIPTFGGLSYYVISLSSIRAL